MDELPTHVAKHFRNINADVEHGRKLKFPLPLKLFTLSSEHVLANLFGGFLSRKARLNGFVQFVERIRVGGSSLEHLRRRRAKHSVAQQHAERRSRKHRPYEDGKTNLLVPVWLPLVFNEVWYQRCNPALKIGEPLLKVKVLLATLLGSIEVALAAL